jgi:DNA polymerase
MDDQVMDAATLLHQVQDHLDSLQRAGVGWLPRAREVLTMAKVKTPRPAANQDATPTVATSASPSEDAGEAAAVDIEATLASRRQSLQVLSQEVAQCTRCPALASTRTQTVFADGQLGAELCFIGEAPGADEDAQGLPFVGAAGQLLNRILAACGLKREDVYICNILKCRPPGNRTPLPDEVANCRGYLERQLALVQPKFICCLGGTAATHLLQTTESLGKLRGRFHDFQGIPVMVTYHPAYLLPHRNPAKKKEVWEDMQTLMAKMGRTIPERTSSEPPSEPPME